MNELPLIDDFYTLQGEGAFMGSAAYFLRLGGCDIGCNWCDTKMSWRADMHKLISVDEIVEKTKQHSADTVVVTGGEPLTYDLTPLCKQLKNINIKTHLETSGSYQLTGKWDWICLSPKRNSPPKGYIVCKANELKVIIQTKDDFLWAEKYAKLVNKDCLLYLQPEWSKHKNITPEIVEYIKQNPKWRISIQAHKFMKIP